MTRVELLHERKAVINHLRANGFPDISAAIVKPSQIVVSEFNDMFLFIYFLIIYLLFNNYFITDTTL